MVFLYSWLGTLNIFILKIQGNYNLEREASEPDPHIVDLNIELTNCEGHLSTAVGEREHAYVFLAAPVDL